jgi:hypothetical protein
MLSSYGFQLFLNLCYYCSGSTYYRYDHTLGHAVTQLVEALHYKPVGREFNARWSHWIFHWLNPFGHAMALGSTQSLTEMSTRDISWGVKADGAYG